jgi:hypothetical protein
VTFQRKTSTQILLGYISDGGINKFRYPDYPNEYIQEPKISQGINEKRKNHHKNTHPIERSKLNGRITLK